MAALSEALIETRVEAPPAVRDATARTTRLVQNGAVAEIAPRAFAVPAGSLHVLTCGSVDDGKSTLIGRMLWDAGALTTDQRAAAEVEAIGADTPAPEG